jgi:hypothetical protein
VEPVIGGCAPGDLCREHARIWDGWAQLNYNWRNPTEWPGGSHIMDSRTSHTDRAADWERKSRAQLEQVERICRSGRSPQCTPKGTPDV